MTPTHQALQNAADKVGAKISSIFQTDKRKKTEKFLLSYNGTGISPVLNYENMNHFILGMIRAKELTNTGNVK